MKKNVVTTGLLAAVLLGNACAFYHVKRMDPKVLAGTGPKGQIVGVRTAGEAFAFPADDPAVVRNGMVLGNVHMGCFLDPVDIVDISPGRLGPNVVLRDGSRFQSPDSRPDGEGVSCEAVRTVCVPVDEVLGVDVRKLDGLGSVLGTLAGVALFAAAVTLDGEGESWFDDDEGGFEEARGGGRYRPSDFLGALLDEAGDTPETARRRSASRVLLGLKGNADPAGETEFWAVDWVPVEALPGADGTIVVALGNGSRAVRTVDEARLVVVDHPPGVRVAADSLDGVRALAAPVPPDDANDGGEADVLAPLAAADGVLWRPAGADAGTSRPALARDELTLGFPRPKGARRARLVVTAANSAWPAEFARECQGRVWAVADAGHVVPREPPYRDWEYGKLRVRLLTVLGWQTAQALFAGGPLPPADRVYDLDLADVGTDKIWIKMAPPAGYWLFDRVALDFGEEPAIEAVALAAASADGPDGAEVAAALEGEGGAVLRLGPGAEPVALTFVLPPPKEGLERTLLLRTVSGYGTPLAGSHNP